MKVRLAAAQLEIVGGRYLYRLSAILLMVFFSGVACRRWLVCERMVDGWLLHDVVTQVRQVSRMYSGCGDRLA